MTEKVTQLLARHIGRRRFLARTTTAAVGFVASMFSMSRTTAAHFVHYACCHLCNERSGCSGYACVWSWTCCHNGDLWRCEEHYASSGGNCVTGDCPASCSAAEIIGPQQCPLSPAA